MEGILFSGFLIQISSGSWWKTWWTTEFATCWLKECILATSEYWGIDQEVHWMPNICCRPRWELNFWGLWNSFILHLCKQLPEEEELKMKSYGIRHLYLEQFDYFDIVHVRFRWLMSKKSWNHRRDYHHLHHRTDLTVSISNQL